MFPLRIEPLALLQVALEIVAIFLPRFQDARLVAEQRARFEFPMHEIFCAMVVWNAQERVMTSRANFFQMAGTESVHVIGDGPHRYADSASPAGKQFAGFACTLEHDQRTGRFCPGFDVTFYFSAMLAPVFRDQT